MITIVSLTGGVLISSMTYIGYKSGDLNDGRIRFEYILLGEMLFSLLVGLTILITFPDKKGEACPERNFK